MSHQRTSVAAYGTVAGLLWGLARMKNSYCCSYCLHLRELMAEVNVKMISGCTNDRWLYAVEKDLGVCASAIRFLLIDNT